MKRHRLLIAGIAAIVIIITSCKKGDMGPQGPKGNANVIYSNWFTPATYKKDTLFGIWGFNHTIAVPDITQSILDSGSVLTFAKMHGYNPAVWPTGTVGQLPITINYMQGGLQVDTWQAYATPGNWRVRFTNDHNIYTTIANQHQFRYIIIPGGTLAGRTSQLSYEEICRMYNIPE
jgi:hypothetical protein